MFGNLIMILYISHTTGQFTYISGLFVYMRNFDSNLFVRAYGNSGCINIVYYYSGYVCKYLFLIFIISGLSRVPASTVVLQGGKLYQVLLHH